MAVGRTEKKKQDMIFSSYSWQFVRPLKLNEYQVGSHTKRNPRNCHIPNQVSSVLAWYYLFFIAKSNKLCKYFICMYVYLSSGPCHGCCYGSNKYCSIKWRFVLCKSSCRKEAKRKLTTLPAHGWAFLIYSASLFWSPSQDSEERKWKYRHNM